MENHTAEEAGPRSSPTLTAWRPHVYGCAAVEAGLCSSSTLPEWRAHVYSLPPGRPAALLADVDRVPHSAPSGEFGEEGEEDASVLWRLNMPDRAEGVQSHRKTLLPF